MSPRGQAVSIIIIIGFTWVSEGAFFAFTDPFKPSLSLWESTVIAFDDAPSSFREQASGGQLSAVSCRVQGIQGTL